MDNKTALIAAGAFLLGWAIGYFTARKKSTALTPQAIVEALLLMGRTERSELRKVIEQRLGETEGAAASVSPAVEDEPGAPQRDLILVDAGTDKAAVIRVIAELTGLDLKSAKEIADKGGSLVLSGSRRRVAHGREELESAGALTEIRTRA